MKINNIYIVFTISIITGCSSVSEYEIRKQKAREDLPKYEAAYQNTNCQRLKFNFERSMSFSNLDANNYLKCLEIEEERNDLRAVATGMINKSELSASKSLNDNRLIFSSLSEGEISLGDARKMYELSKIKAEQDASSEISYSNALYRQGLENQRRTWEEQNTIRENMFKSLQRSRPIVTRCKPNLSGSVDCTTTQ
ncbi:hypothetical protein JHL22_00590 [Advenella sp. WQ 585]|uniref:Lipoprotein n=1 Tax=Advenella mandrilli TaxID=2800330 RepID=A0ABS1E831_9BURK|nr:hypothetical protein [Advenella mandrilli]MBK1779707.1 hypothetical protein [Advenella mandrilli]